MTEYSFEIDFDEDSQISIRTLQNLETYLNFVNSYKEELLRNPESSFIEYVISKRKEE
eukprot:Pgem_evm1s15665